MNTQLDDFYNHLNEAVITTNDFNEGTKFRKREKVAQYSYCGLNQKYRRYLVAPEKPVFSACVL